MAEFRRLYQKDLLDHSPVAHTDQAEFRAWSKRFAQWLFSTDHIAIRYGIDYDGVDIRKLSPGTRGIVLLLLYLALDDSDNRPLVIDQPEENLDPKSVFDELVDLFVEAKSHRQVIMVTHNANLVINTDADQIIIAEAGPHPHGALPPISYRSGGVDYACGWSGSMATAASSLSYVDLAATRHLTTGLTFDLAQCVPVLDHALLALNEQTGIPDQLITWIRAGALAAGPCPYDGRGRIIIDVTQTVNAEGQHGYFATVLRKSDERETAPVVFLSMHSPTLDIPMRVEIPLRAMLLGNPPLAGTYTLYLHALLTNQASSFIY
jgi:energy-coupling factor transporter ATP-binding protein EcfA2